METLIAWAGFAGAWLLFAGPIFQAAIELGQENGVREAVGRRIAAVEPPEPISGWWWLLPPVGYLKRRRSARAFREQVMGSLQHSEMEALVSYMNKATGWLLVGLGGLLIAVKETWELTAHQQWPTGAFWALVLGMLLLSLTFLAMQMNRSGSALGGDAGARAGGHRGRRTAA